MSEHVIRGTCRLMCPVRERRMREREGLLHKFEIEENPENKRRPRADPAKTVKCFARPAAGQVMTDPDQLRPPPVLMSTIEYLFTKIATDTKVDWLVAYDFIFDRLRAVRQDIVIQRIDPAESIKLFEPIVRFLVYSAHRLCERTMSEYDPKINNQHLTECVKHLLVLYDETEKNCGKSDSIGDSSRQQIEALYILIHIGDGDALQRALNLPQGLRDGKEVRLAIKLSLAWYLKNYARVCALIHQLPPILICAALIKLQTVRRTALRIMSVAYNSKTLTYPGLKLQELLLYRSITKLEADCKLFGLKFVNQNVLFEKTSFNEDVKLASPEMYYKTDTLHDFLPDALLRST